MHLIEGKPCVRRAHQETVRPVSMPLVGARRTIGVTEWKGFAAPLPTLQRYNISPLVNALRATLRARNEIAPHLMGTRALLVA